MNSNKREIFDATHISKDWKDQKVSFNGNFVDPHFPPNSNSVQAKDKNNKWIDPESGPSKFEDIKDMEIEWKRAKEIFSKFLIFDDKIEFDDVKQGSLGNCYFLSAIAAMTEFPNMIAQIFRTKEVNPEGYYEIVMFIDGEWQVVILDDYFPVKKGTKELDAIVKGERIRLVQIRNPWGYKEWNDKWSDNSYAWTPET